MLPRRLALFFVTTLLLTACATVPKPVTSPLPGKEVETLQSSISLAVKAGGKSIGGRGYLIYRHPDRFHLVILSPFGLTMFELFASDDRLTCVVPSRSTAYSGSISELPERHPLKSWGLMRWVAERPPATDSVPGSRECTTPDGRRETVTYDEHGLVQMKEDEEGNRVAYRDYASVNGSAVPENVELANRFGDTVRIVFDEPEVNVPIEDGALTPRLDGFTLLPLAAFQGM